MGGFANIGGYDLWENQSLSEIEFPARSKTEIPGSVLLRPDVVDDRFSASHIDDDMYHIVRRTDQHLSVVVKDSTF